MKQSHMLVALLLVALVAGGIWWYLSQLPPGPPPPPPRPPLPPPAPNARGALATILAPLIPHNPTGFRVDGIPSVMVAGKSVPLPREFWGNGPPTVVPYDPNYVPGLDG